MLARQAELLLLEEEDGGKSSNLTFMTALDGSAAISPAAGDIPPIHLAQAGEEGTIVPTEHGVCVQDDPDAQHEVFRVLITPNGLTIVPRLPMLLVAVL